MSDQVAKWYTRARRFPRLIGKLPDGSRIPFGPFTIFQVVGGAGVFIVMVQTISVWGVFGLLGNVVLLMGCSITVLFVLGKLPMSTANAPLTALGGLVTAAFPSPAGKVGGQPIRIAKPHRDRARLIIHILRLSTAAPPSAAEQPVPQAEQKPALSAVSPAQQPLPLTSVQLLLASVPKD